MGTGNGGDNADNQQMMFTEEVHVLGTASMYAILLVGGSLLQGLGIYILDSDCLILNSDPTINEQ